MPYKRFEDLPVWSASAKLAREIYRLTRQERFPHEFSLKSQLERAALSISSNIAEGFEQGTQKELINFLFIAKGSSGEVRSILLVIREMPDFADCETYNELLSQAEGISRQLSGWISALRSSDKTGHRQLA